MFTPLGKGTLITNLNALSSTPKSISLLCTLISNLSKLALPLPQGLFLVVIFSFLVGSGIGPLISIPVLSAISLMLLQILFSLFIFILARFILAFDITRFYKKGIYKPYGI